MEQESGVATAAGRCPRAVWMEQETGTATASGHCRQAVLKGNHDTTLRYGRVWTPLRPSRNSATAEYGLRYGRVGTPLRPSTGTSPTGGWRPPKDIGKPTGYQDRAWNRNVRLVFWWWIDSPIGLSKLWWERLCCHHPRRVAIDHQVVERTRRENRGVAVLPPLFRFFFLWSSEMNSFETGTGNWILNWTWI